MCLALPGKIEKIEQETAIVDYGGIKKEANVSFVDCKIGDYILVHVGFAIETVDPSRAKAMYDLIEEHEKENERNH